MKITRSSFTLIEMLSVMVIIAIIAAGAAPQFVNSYAPFLLRKTADDIKSGARWAQARAMGEHRVYALSISSDRRTYAFVRAKDDTDDPEFEPAHARAGKPQALPKDVKMATETDMIRFYPDATIDPSTVVLTSKDHRIELSSAMMRGAFVVVRDE